MYGRVGNCLPNPMQFTARESHQPLRRCPRMTGARVNGGSNLDSPKVGSYRNNGPWTVRKTLRKKSPSPTAEYSSGRGAVGPYKTTGLLGKESQKKAPLPQHTAVGEGQSVSKGYTRPKCSKMFSKYLIDAVGDRFPRTSLCLPDGREERCDQRLGAR